MKTTRFVSLVACLIGWAALTPAFAGSEDKRLDIYWVDSEGGGSTLIVTPTGESILIDTGNPGGRDPGRIVAAAKAAGLARIDHVLITHWHGDHFGGAAEVAQQMPFGTIYERAIPDGDPDGGSSSTFPVRVKPYREIPAKRAALAPGIEIPLKQVERAGLLRRTGPKIALRCIAADKKVIEPTPAQRKQVNPLTSGEPPRPVAPTDNDNSAVFVLSFGDFTFFDGGDLTWPYEAKLVIPHNVVGIVDVYQTNHHGLEVSNNPVLMQSLAPTVVVMNNGPKKGGQPGTFAGLKTAKSIEARYQVHKSYNVPAEENAPDEYIANHENLTGADAAKCPANVIKLSVAPDAKSYTVTVPSTGHSRTFATKAK